MDCVTSEELYFTTQFAIDRRAFFNEFLGRSSRLLSQVSQQRTLPFLYRVFLRSKETKKINSNNHRTRSNFHRVVVSTNASTER